jgi:hypothetical protein
MKMVRCSMMLQRALLPAIPTSAEHKISGCGFDFSGNARVRVGGIMAQAWKDLAVREAFIVVAPDAFDPAARQSGVDPPKFFKAVGNQVRAILPIEESRIYLFGASADAA